MTGVGICNRHLDLFCESYSKGKRRDNDRGISF